MKRSLILLLVFITLITSSAVLVFASDVDNAQYKTTITISNNGSAAEDVFATFSLNTTAMIDGGLLSDNASDAVMIADGGDTAFMPSVNDTYPWCTYVPSIGGNSQKVQYLYSVNATGGQIVWFPGDAGSTNATAMPSLADNFTIEQSGWVNTNSNNGMLIYYPGGVATCTNSGNITSAILGSGTTTMSLYLRPNAAGDNTTIPWVYSSDNDSTHYKAVDDWIGSSDNNSSYVTSGAAATQYGDYYNLENPTSSNWTGNYQEIANVEVNVIRSSPSADGVNTQPFLKLGGVEIAGTETATNSTTYVLRSDNLTRPGGGVWTVGDIANLQVGLGVKGSGTNLIRVTQVYVRVYYTNPVSVTASGISSGNMTVKTEYKPNLLTNSSFETGDPPTGWTASAANYNRTNTEWQVGLYSCNISSNGTWGNIYQNLANSATYVGKTLTFAAKVKAMSTNDKTQVLIINESGVGNSNSSVIPKDNAWHWVSVNRTIVGGGQIQSMVRINNGAVADTDDLLYIDSAILIVGTSISDYNTFRLFIDEGAGFLEKDQVYTEVAVPNNSENWTFCEADAMPYVEYLEISVPNDTPVQRIEWEYDTIFHDSINSYDIIPTFRTTSSDADVSAVVTSQEGLKTGSTPSANVSGGWTMIGSVPAEPENLFSEGADSYGIGGFNIGEQVTAAAEGAGDPPEVWHFLFAFGLCTFVMVIVFGGTHNTRMGQKGSLVMAVLAGGLVMVFFYRAGTIPGWVLIPFGLIAVLLIMWRKSPSPVD